MKKLLFSLGLASALSLGTAAMATAGTQQGELKKQAEPGEGKRNTMSTTLDIEGEIDAMPGMLNPMMGIAEQMNQAKMKMMHHIHQMEMRMMGIEMPEQPGGPSMPMDKDKGTQLKMQKK